MVFDLQILSKLIRFTAAGARAKVHEPDDPRPLPGSQAR